MAANIFQEDEDVIAQINIVPFVDIVLVLLIIFMLTSSAIVRASISVELPTAASANETVSSTLNVVIKEDGSLFRDGEPTDLDALGSHVSREAWKNKELQAVISADRSVDYGEVIRVVDVIKQNGIKVFALNIQRAH